MALFSDYKLTEEQEKKGRKILRTFLRREYFGKSSLALVRIVAENMDTINLVSEAERMIDWCDTKKVEVSIARYSTWIRKLGEFKKERAEKSMDTSTDLEKDLEKVKKFQEKYGLHQQKKG